MATRGSMHDRLAQLEREVSALKSALRSFVQPALPRAIRSGQIIGKLTTNLEAGGTCTVKLWIWDGTNLVETTKEVTACRAWGSPDTIPADTMVFGKFHEQDDRFYIVGPSVLLCKTTGSFAKNSSQSLDVYKGTLGSETDSGINVTAYNKFATIATGKWVMVAWNGFGWYAIATEC